MLDRTAASSDEDIVTERKSVSKKLPNFIYPDIRPVRADKFVIDFSSDRQRDPGKRKQRLIRQFGENGEKFDFDLFEVVTAVPRPDGTFFPSGGMGRVWAILNLVKRPDLELPTLIKRQSGDQAEIRSFYHTQTNVVPIAKGQLFMTEGRLTGTKWSEHRAIVETLDGMGCSTAPNFGPNAVTLSAAVFCGRLGQLREAHTLARRWWFAAKTPKGEYKFKVEGTAMDVCGALLYTYGPFSKAEWARLDKLFEGKNFEDLRRSALDDYSDPDAQNRDQAPYIARKMIERFNSRQPAGKRWDRDELLQIRMDFADDPFWKDMHDAWRMKDRDAE